MDETAYYAACDDAFAEVEQLLDDAGADCFQSGGVLEAETDDGGKIVVSRQTPLREIWVAAKSGGRHFRQNEKGDWADTVDGRLLLEYIRSLV